MPVSDEFAATCTAALLCAFIAKKVTVTWRAAEQLTSSGLLEAFSDGFACFLHEKFGKEEENIGREVACKVLKGTFSGCAFAKEHRTLNFERPMLNKEAVEPNSASNETSFTIRSWTLDVRRSSVTRLFFQSNDPPYRAQTAADIQD